MIDITIGQYFPGNSPIHKIDPRVKILFTLIFMIFVFTLKSKEEFLLIGLITFLIIKMSKVPFKYYFKGVKPVLFVMIFTALLNLFLSSGNVIFKLPLLGWTITDRGVELSVYMILRLTFLLMGTSVLTFTTSPVMLTDGIENLLSPFKKIGVPSHEIAMMMTIALKFIPTFAEEADKIRKAQSARGADFETGSLYARAKSIVPILVPLFVGAFRRADELAVAMESRCYRGGEGRTSFKQLKLGIYDLYTLIFVLLVTALFTFIKISG